MEVKNSFDSIKYKRFKKGKLFKFKVSPSISSLVTYGSFLLIYAFNSRT